MRATDVMAIAVGSVTLVGGFTGAIKWLVKHYLSELRPNGGGSLRDAINRTEERSKRTEERVDKIYEILCERDK